MGYETRYFCDKCGKEIGPFVEHICKKEHHANKRLEEIKTRHTHVQQFGIGPLVEAQRTILDGDVPYLLARLAAEVKRREAAEAVIESGGAAEYQTAIVAWRQLVKEANSA